MIPTLITDVRAFALKPDKHNLVVVKITTNRGVEGIGCATFQFRPTLVVQAVEEYLRPVLMGRDANEIEDLWHVMYYNSYWRRGPVLNSAISGVDMALWDIKGKLADMPLYELWGGRSRTAIPAYTHAVADDFDELCSQIDAYRSEGYRYLRVQLGFYGGNPDHLDVPRDPIPGSYFDTEQYIDTHIELFRRIRERYGSAIELLHDVHERLAPAQALRFLKGVEPYRPFFIEDPVALENTSWLTRMKAQCATPIAEGELFIDPADWTGLLVDRAIDYLRIHVSQIGGITPALKVAHLAEAFGVKIAWHTPSDISPVGLAVNTHLNIHLANAAIQEHIDVPQNTRSVFSGAPEVEGGFFYPSDRPGIGVTFNEEAARAFPQQFKEHPWCESRTPDGTVVAP